MRTALPWFVSLLTLDPKVQYVASLPLVMRLRMLGGVVLIALFPFSGLVRLAVFPV